MISERNLFDADDWREFGGISPTIQGRHDFPRTCGILKERCDLTQKNKVEDTHFAWLGPVRTPKLYKNDMVHPLEGFLTGFRDLARVLEEKEYLFCWHISPLFFVFTPESRMNGLKVADVPADYALADPSDEFLMQVLFFIKNRGFPDPEKFAWCSNKTIMCASTKKGVTVINDMDIIQYETRMNEIGIALSRKMANEAYARAN